MFNSREPPKLGHVDNVVSPIVEEVRPLDSCQQLLQLILPHMVDRTFMAFPVPLQTLSDIMDQYCTFEVSKIIAKNICYLLYVTFNPFIASICRY